MLEISSDKKELLNNLQVGSAYVVQGEAGTGKTFVGILCGQKILKSQKSWQKVLYLTYSKLAKWQIDKTRLMLEGNGFILPSQGERMEIQNFHSLWWSLVFQNSSFLGLSTDLRICLDEELRHLSDDCLSRLSSQEREEIIPKYFLTKKGEYNNRSGYYNRLIQAMQGEALLYAQWGPENFGSRAVNFIGQSKFLAWAKSVIEQRNKSGLLSHAETIWWSYQLLLKHPTIINLIKAEYPIVIIDEFQDTDIAQWEMLRLLSPETIIVMSDVKQTIHSWRGANSAKRLEEFKGFCRNSKKYSDILEFRLTKRHRSPKCMSDSENITRAYIKSDDSPRDDFLRTRTLWKCKMLLRRCNGKTVGILCTSNSLTESVTNNLRQSQKTDGQTWGHSITCSRLGASNSPFEVAREIVHCFIQLGDAPDNLRLFVANELHWIILPLPKSQLKKCSAKSKKRILIKRWRRSNVLADMILSDFGYGLILLRKYFFRLEKRHECRCDKSILNCISHIGQNIQKLGKKWNKQNVQEKKAKIDSLVMQYENAYASSRKEQRISVMTVHQSKGREFDVVIIPWFNKSKWDSKDSFEWNTSDTEIANIFHTACTRARENVFVISTRELEAKWPV